MKLKSFTIIELLVSIMIIGILSTIGYKQYTEAVDKAKAKRLVNTIKKYNTTISEFYKTHQYYPTIGDQNKLEMVKFAKENGFKDFDASNNPRSGLGPRSYISIDQNFSHNYWSKEAAAERNATFRYIVVHDVPGKIAGKVVKEMNGNWPSIDSTTVDCKMDENFIAVVSKGNHPQSANTDGGAGNCLGLEYLNDSSKTSDQLVDLYYTFSRSLGIKTTGAGDLW